MAALFGGQQHSHHRDRCLPTSAAPAELGVVSVIGVPLNRIIATGQSGASGTTFYDYNYDYTPGSGGSPTSHIYARRETSNGNGTRLEYSYDNQGAMNQDKTYDKSAAGTQTAASLYCYTSEPVGNRTSVSGKDTTCSGQTPTKYNGANQSTTTDHTFDAAGNETKMVTPTPANNTTRTTTWADDNAAATMTINGAAAHATTNDYLGSGNNTIETRTGRSGDLAMRRGGHRGS